MRLEREAFAAWLDRYVAAWRSYDPTEIGDLFSEDATYSYRAGTLVVNGRAAIVASWLEDRDEPGSWDAHYDPLAIDDHVHVAVGWSHYIRPDRALREEYRNIFVCRFDAGGRCSEFTEWWMDTTAGRESEGEATG